MVRSSNSFKSRNAFLRFSIFFRNLNLTNQMAARQVTNFLKGSGGPAGFGFAGLLIGGGIVLASLNSSLYNGKIFRSKE